MCKAKNGRGYTAQRWLSIGIMLLLGSMTGLAMQEHQPTDLELVSYPEMLLYNGKIVSMDDRSVNPVPGTTAEAMAIRGGEILALGSSDVILGMAGPNTQRINLGGRTVIPGLINTHTHLHDSSSGQGMPPGVLPIIIVDGETPEEVAKNIEILLKEAVRTAKPDQFIRMRVPAEPGLELIIFEQKFRRGDLDAITSEIPVFISIHVGRSLMNGKAIETIQDFFGYSMPSEVLDKESGTTWSTDFSRGLGSLFFADHRDLLVENVRKQLEGAAAMGMTAFSSHIQLPVFIGVYAQLDREGQMPIRFAWSHRSGNIFNSIEGAQGFYSRIGDLMGTGSDYFWNVGATIGGLDLSYPMIKSSVPARPEIKEREVDSTEEGTVTYVRRQAMLAMVRAGLRIAGTHISGDGAVDDILDVIEEGSKQAGITLEQIRAKQHNIDHCQMSPRPDQYERIKRFNITMSCNPNYVESTAPEVLRDYGEKYVEWVSPMKSLIDAGVKTVWEGEGVQGDGAFHSLELAVTRKGSDGRVFGESEKIDRVVALKTATSWASEYVLRPDRIGTLERGKLADFLILNRDYFTVPEDEIHEVRPLTTVVGGKIVYLDPTLAVDLGLEPVGIQPRFVR